MNVYKKILITETGLQQIIVFFNRTKTTTNHHKIGIKANMPQRFRPLRTFLSQDLFDIQEIYQISSKEPAFFVKI